MDQATATCVCRLHASEARRPEAGKPGRRRQGWKPKWGEPRSARLDAKHDSATGLIKVRRRLIFQYSISFMRTRSKAGASGAAKMRTINVFIGASSNLTDNVTLGCVSAKIRLSLSAPK